MNLTQTQKEQRFDATFGVEAISLNSPAGALLGVGLFGSAGVSIWPTFEMGVGFEQGDSLTGGFSLLYTAVHISASYAITGTFRGVDSSVVLDEQEVAHVHQGMTGGFRGQIYFTQFFLNGAKNIVSFNGPGFGASYEFPTLNNMNPGVLARVDLLSSSTISVQNWQFSFIYSIHY